MKSIYNARRRNNVGGKPALVYEFAGMWGE